MPREAGIPRSLRGFPGSPRQGAPRRTRGGGDLEGAGRPASPPSGAAMPGPRKRLPREQEAAAAAAAEGILAKAPSPPHLGAAFFDQPCVRLARALLGQILVRRLPDGRALRGRIVETEAYLGGEDTASHSRGGRQTARNMAMFMAPGTLYVYQIYGIYFCMNISSRGQVPSPRRPSAWFPVTSLLAGRKPPEGPWSWTSVSRQNDGGGDAPSGEGAAVLLRSLEPLQGLEAMRELRLAQRKGAPRPLKDRHLCNGPSKLCQALAVDKTFDQQDLACHPAVWLEPGLGAPREEDVISAPRIGISGEWAQQPLRFYVWGNPCVSVTNKAAEGARGSRPPAEASPCC
ncbi:DNA-3-methyladenine glycosylase isoform X1 [Podarcis raffonei]|uniref:DNA-3-methyladenine glycosylase isoform X1 n=1 Tax=Podarcis raffonei TaxID=65483 RepID=UPI00232908AF|nr:DNA-3-methyladenine glycosylase isoform X1 [Podarcis raffonei]